MTVFDLDLLLAYRRKAHTYTTPRRMLARGKALLTSSVTSGGMGLDASAWQLEINALAAKAAGLLFGIFRARYGLTIDAKFAQHWTAFSGVLPRSAYLYYLDTQDAFEQADKLFESIPAADREEITVVVDIEGYGNPTLTNAKIKAVCERITYLFGRKPMIYTGYWIWQGITGDKTWAAAYPLWLAAYPLTGWADDYPTKVLNYPPNVPSPWQMWTANPDEPLEGRVALWQWTAYAPASQYGASGLTLDLNHCSPAFAKKYALGETLPPPPDPVPVGEPILKYTNLTSAPNIRSSPAVVNNPTNDVGDLPKNSVIVAQEIRFLANGSSWIRFEPDPAWITKTVAEYWVSGFYPGQGVIMTFHSSIPCPEGEPVPMTPEQLQRLENLEATTSRHDLEIITLQNTLPGELFIATHKLVTTKTGGEKLRAYPNGSEAVQVFNGASLMDLHQTRAGQMLMGYEKEGVIITGFLDPDVVVEL